MKKKLSKLTKVICACSIGLASGYGVVGLAATPAHAQYGDIDLDPIVSTVHIKQHYTKEQVKKVVDNMGNVNTAAGLIGLLAIPGFPFPAGFIIAMTSMASPGDYFKTAAHKETGLTIEYDYVIRRSTNIGEAKNVKVTYN